MTSGAFAGLAPCVHCGFCLQSCPTFLVTGDEADSPRGRIVLLRALERGELPASDPALQHHLDRCLGCRACEPVCPSGVSYGPALEEARRRFIEERRAPALARLVLAVMAQPLLRRPLLGATRLLRPVTAVAARGLRGTRLGFMSGMVAATRGRMRSWPDGRTRTPVRGHLRSRSTTQPPNHPTVALFRGCIMEGLFGHVHRATERTLAVNGFDVIPAPGQTCCGALHAHAGHEGEAQELARRNVQALHTTSADHIVVNAAGCGAALKEYGRLLAGDPLEAAAREVAAQVVDVTEALAEAGPIPGARLDVAVAYDPPCHLLHAQRIAEAPLRVLQAVPGLTRVPVEDADLCCGSAGSYTLTQPELSAEVLARKVSAIARAKLDVVVTGNPGCIMQIGAGLRNAGLDIPVLHPVEILDRSYQAAGLYSSLGQ